MSLHNCQQPKQWALDSHKGKSRIYGRHTWVSKTQKHNLTKRIHKPQFISSSPKYTQMSNRARPRKAGMNVQGPRQPLHTSSKGGKRDDLSAKKKESSISLCFVAATLITGFPSYSALAFQGTDAAMSSDHPHYPVHVLPELIAVDCCRTCRPNVELQCTQPLSEL